MNQILSQNLKRLRTEKNYTQEEAARLLGVTAQTVSRWECNTTLPDVTLLPEIAKLYCVIPLFRRYETVTIPLRTLKSVIVCNIKNASHHETLGGSRQNPFEIRKSLLCFILFDHPHKKCSILLHPCAPSNFSLHLPCNLLGNTLQYQLII